MHILPYIGLFVALASAPLLIALLRFLHVKSLSVTSRLAFWGVTIVVVVIAFVGGGTWFNNIGLSWLTWSGVALGILAALVMLFGAIASQLLTARKSSKQPAQQPRQTQGILQLSFAHRLLIVVTAAVTEEVLYRGYAIGIGQHLIGGIWVAAVLSATIFTVSHYRWGRAQLAPVAICTVVVTLLFVFTRNLWICMIAHAVADSVGFLVLPAVAASRQRQLAGSLG